MLIVLKMTMKRNSTLHTTAMIWRKAVRVLADRSGPSPYFSSILGKTKGTMIMNMMIL